VPGVPSPIEGPVVLHATLRAADGSRVTHPLLVARNAMPVIDLNLHLDEARQVTITMRRPGSPRTASIAHSGRLSFRLLDASGATRYERGLNGTGVIIYEHAGGDCSLSDLEPVDDHVVAPDLPQTHDIVFVDEAGCTIGQSPW
jgi:hypothetical protein